MRRILTSFAETITGDRGFRRGDAKTLGDDSHVVGEAGPVP